MINPAAAKLVHHYQISSEVAERLVEAGLGSPGRIGRASKSELMKVEGIGSATADKLKGK